MRIRPLGLVAITIALAGIAVAAVAFGPANLAKLGAPSGTNTPQASSLGVPPWHVGDSWTYNVNSTPPNVFIGGPTWRSPSVTGPFATTVASASGSGFTVSCHTS